MNDSYLIQFLKFSFILLLFPTFSIAQTDSSYLKTEEVLEDLLQEPIGEIDDSNLYELVEELLRNPINLNNADVSELQRIPGVDLASAQLIVDHKKKYGDFFSINELNAVQNLDQKIIKQISPFVFVPPPEFLQTIL